MSTRTSKIIVLSEEQFDARFPLLTNHFDMNASLDGCMFETYGEEFAFVQQQSPNCIWTLMTSNDGQLCLSSGYHFVNRLGYVITTVPVERGRTFVVLLEERDSDGEPSPNQPPALAKLRSFRISIEQPSVHTIIVEAVDRDTAIEKAEIAFLEEPGFFPEDPPAGWQRRFNDWDIVEAEEVQP
jgi:hypothetical protein